MDLDGRTLNCQVTGLDSPFSPHHLHPPVFDDTPQKSSFLPSERNNRLWRQPASEFGVFPSTVLAHQVIIIKAALLARILRWVFYPYLLVGECSMMAVRGEVSWTYVWSELNYDWECPRGGRWEKPRNLFLSSAARRRQWCCYGNDRLDYASNALLLLLIVVFTFCVGNRFSLQQVHLYYLYFRAPLYYQ